MKWLRESVSNRQLIIDINIALYILWYMSTTHTKTILNIKTDKVLKKSAQETATELGIPLSTAVNAFLRQFVRDREITLSASYTPSVYLEKILKEAEQDRKNNKIATFDNVDTFLSDLDL